MAPELVVQVAKRFEIPHSAADDEDHGNRVGAAREKTKHAHACALSRSLFDGRTVVLVAGGRRSQLRSLGGPSRAAMGGPGVVDGEETRVRFSQPLVLACPQAAAA